MKNRRILHVIVGIGVGGAETALLRSSKELVMRGYEIRVLCLFRYFDLLKEFEDAGVKVYFLSRLFRQPKLLLDVFNWRPHYLMAWLPLAHLVSIVLNPILGAKVLIWNVRQTLSQFDRLPLRSKFFLKLAAVFSRRPDAIIYNSNRGLDDHRKFGFWGQRELVIPNGFDEHVVWTESEKQLFRRKFGLGEQSLIFSFVGRNHTDKGADIFIEAALSFFTSCDGADHNVQFVIAGKGFENEANKWGDKIHFLGVLDRKDVNAVYAITTLYTSSSRTEGFSNSIGEAMAHGNFPVVTDVGDSKIIVGNVGMVVPPSDHMVLVQAWRQYLDFTPARRSSLLDQAMRRVQNEYSIRKTVDAYDFLLNEFNV